jgi:Na+/H+ antiporter NhaD/arsenite permease-like protein
VLGSVTVGPKLVGRMRARLGVCVVVAMLVIAGVGVGAALGQPADGDRSTGAAGASDEAGGAVPADAAAAGDIETRHDAGEAPHGEGAEHGASGAGHGEAAHGEEPGQGHGGAHHAAVVPPVPWVAPFVILLLCIAILPLIHKTEHWWEKNSSKLLVALILAVITTGFYYFRDYGFPHGAHVTATGVPCVKAMLHHAVIADYIPFIVLLFSLYVISGGINVRGDIPAHPLTNTVVIGIGAAIASFVGTTGAAMLLIRPLLQINSERRIKRHTVIFFIFAVCNVGGCLLPIGDPPLFLGYLRGVHFLWTFHLWKEWLFCNAVILAVYFVWDTLAYRREAKPDIRADEIERQPLQFRGLVNLVWIVGVIFGVALLVPGTKLPGTEWTIPMFLREGVQLLMALLSWLTTRMQIRRDNSFNFFAITEVACLFIGIFICMQVPVEILKARGGDLGLTQPWHFFWATGALSSFLDNAPTYAVYFETAGAVSIPGAAVMEGVKTATGQISIPLLAAVSLGAVFMGANTYIGNGPNFMVKSIAEQSGIKMPSFFGYMAYSLAILLPIFVVVTLIFLV